MQLKHFQEVGADFLFERKSALLADEMRVGKTPQVIRCIDMLSKFPVIVICPACAITNWKIEIRNFSVFNWKVRVLYKTTDEPLRDGINICSFNQAVSKKLLPKLKFIMPKVIIIDESHYLKSKKAARTRAIYGKKFNRKDSLTHHVENLYLLSGTPVPNKVTEIWTTLKVLGVCKYNHYDFRCAFAKGYYDNSGEFQITGVKNVKKLKSILEPIMLRRKLDEVMPELKPINITKYYMEPAIVDEELYFMEWAKRPEKKKILMSENNKIKRILDSDLSDDEKLNALAKSKGRATATVRRYTALSKIEPVCKLVEEMLMSGVPNIAIFAHHRDVIVGIRDRLKFLKPVIIWGGTDAKKRQKRLEAFRAGRTRVFIGNLMAAGIAIDLSCTSNVIMVELDYVPGTNAQVMARFKGINQKHIIDVKIATIPDSLDSDIIDILERKIITINEILS